MLFKCVEGNSSSSIMAGESKLNENFLKEKEQNLSMLALHTSGQDQETAIIGECPKCKSLSPS